MAAPLPIGKILAGAFLVPWWNRKAFALGLMFPLGLLATLMLGWYYTDALLPGFVKFLLCVVWAGLFTLFAVTCHRLVLVEPLRVEVVPRWSRRESLFLGWMVGAWIFYFLTFLLVLTIAVNAAGRVVGHDLKEWFAWFEAGAKLPALYVFARLSPLFPATAIDRRVDMKWAWELTRGNGLRLMIVVGLLPWVLSYVAGFLYRSEATSVEFAALTVLGIGLFAIEIAALSLAYRELTRSA